MAILIDANTKVLCQGITGSFGAVHTKGCFLYGTKMAGGVTPGKGGTKDANGLPIFDTVQQAVDATGATATMIFVPPAFTADAILEAADAGIKVICAITEGVPVQDMIRVRSVLDEMNGGASTPPSKRRIVLVGPNCPGVITPGPRTNANSMTGEPGAPFTNNGCKIGIMPGYINTHISQSKRGKAIGIVSLAEAFRMAEEADVDLVEIAPTAVPPVCRLMDYGKFKYQEQKRQHEAKLKQKVISVTEVKFRPGTDDGDYSIKLRNLVKFLDEGDKTKITLRFRGREMAHQEIGVRMLERLKADLEPYGQVEQFPKMEGRQMVMVLAPKKKK